MAEELSRIASRYLDKDGNPISFEEQLGFYAYGEMPTGDLFVISSSSRDLNIPTGEDIPVTMTQKVIKKIQVVHEISIRELMNLEHWIKDSPLSMESLTVDNALAVIGDAKDRYGNDILIAIHLERDKRSFKLDEISSVYGKRNLARLIEMTDRAGLKFYANERTGEWIRRTGLQLPERIATRLCFYSTLNRAEGTRALKEMSKSELEELWGEFGDVAIDDNECIDRAWRGYEAGTPREEIWLDFDEAYPGGVHSLMFPDAAGDTIPNMPLNEVEKAYREFLELPSDGDGRTAVQWRGYPAGTPCDAIAKAFEDAYPSGTDGLEDPDIFIADYDLRDLRNIKVGERTAEALLDCDPSHAGALLNTFIGKLSPIVAVGQRADGAWTVARLDGTAEGTRAVSATPDADGALGVQEFRDEARKQQTMNLLRSGKCFFTTGYLPNDEGPIGYAFITFPESRDYRGKGGDPKDDTVREFSDGGFYPLPFTPDELEEVLGPMSPTMRQDAACVAMALASALRPEDMPERDALSMKSYGESFTNIIRCSMQNMTDSVERVAGVLGVAEAMSAPVNVKTPVYPKTVPGVDIAHDFSSITVTLDGADIEGALNSCGLKATPENVVGLLQSDDAMWLLHEKAADALCDAADDHFKHGGEQARQAQQDAYGFDAIKETATEAAHAAGEDGREARAPRESGER